ncbi:hypothetical protein DY000_02055280 [Brassica cretica]|uniref:C3H1-type domain-containing protein n=1 Tax=Brassica cretica TaxID=69181 RepID=A0ABQ7ABH0_BRACR|nr:hypothetical protein DY000_02055280 [Brassica cretica]
MDSSHYNPSYGQWNPPLPLLPPPPPVPPPPPPPPPRESHPDSPNFYVPPSQNGEQRLHYLPPKPAVNHPSPYYSQQPPPQQHLQCIPEKFSYESQKVSQPLSFKESRDISQSAGVGYSDRRLDSWTVDAAQGRRDSSGVGINRGFDGSSWSRDEFRNLGHLRKESGAARIDGNYQDRGQLQAECFRGLDDGHRSLSSRVGYSSEGARNLRWNEARRRDEYYHLDRGRREGSNESKRTPRKRTQKKSALLRLETPRSHLNGRENARNRCSYSGRRFNSNSFKCKEHLGYSDRGLVENQRGRTSVNLDVSFQSNRLLAKPVASPASAGIHPRLSVTPRSSKAGRALVPDKSEKASVTEENGNKSILKSHEDLLDRTGTGCKALLPKGMEMEDNVKKKTNTSPKKLLISWSTVADLSRGSEARIRFAGMSMCSVGSQPCEDVDMDCLPSTNLSVMDVNAEDDSKGINKNVDFLSPANDSRRCLPKGQVYSASLDIPNVSTELANANNNVSGDLANAHSFTVCTFTNTTVNPLVENENGSRTESMETTARNSAAEMADNRDSDKGEKAFAKDTSSSLAEVDVKESSIVLPIERTDGCSCSGESGLAMAVPSDVCMENVSAERLVSDEDLGIASHYPAEIPSVDQLSGSTIRGLEVCLHEPDVSLSKCITDGSVECLVQRDVRQKDSTFCNSLPGSPPLVTKTNLAVGINGMSAYETVTDAESGLLESQPCSTVPDAFGTVWNLAVNKNLDEDPSRASYCLVSDSLVIPCHISPLVAVTEQIQNKTSIQANYSDSRDGIMHEENNCAEKPDVDTQDEKTYPSGGTLNYKTRGTDIVAVTGGSVFPSQSLSSSPRRSFRQIRSEIHVAATVDETCKDKPKPKHSGGTSKYRTGGTNIFAFSGDSVPCDSLSNPPRLYRQIRSEVHVASMVDDTSNYKEKAKPSGGTSKCRTPEADVTSDVGGQEKYSLNRVKTDIFDGEVWSSVVNVSGAEILGDSGVPLSRSHSNGKVHVISVRDRDSQSKTSLSSWYHVENMEKKSNYSAQKRFSRALPFVSGPKKDANPSNKCHTWHRKFDTSASPLVAVKPLSPTLITQPKFPIVTAQSSSSYVRKGNSLLRKPSYGSLVKTGEIITLERQSNPSSDSSTSKVSNAIVTSSGKSPLSYSRDHLISGLPESIMDSATSEEANVAHSGGDASKTSDTLIQTYYASDCQQKRNHPKLDSSNLKRTVYVKRKANQLIAASDIHGAIKGKIRTSDGYFKRSKNQLVRTSASGVSHSPDDALDSQAATTMVSKRSSSTAFSHSAVTRPYKRSKFSLVWTQNDPQSRLRTSHMRYQRILPQLVPWKRVTYWRRLMKSVSGSALRNSSFSKSSQKLSMMRKRHTVYTRSTNGYSLRKSKVLSLGGSHLKWSKSIERDSRKANQEATLTAAEFSKKESEKHSGQSTTRMTSRNHLTRERVFRIVSLRYKMDSSRRTLQRISDDDSPCSGPTENGKGAERPFIPKRLVIGNEEYVRVGNGNQLVRDPKKRTRALANEKVRWSLHNVRLRSAKKKKKYCQFFTRFGKCSKDDGKCPYVHDPSKIAVCTKFLNGLCANETCKLTHKVIPARMPDCSYFLQGLCNNDACPYRHVHVNPSAAICDGFLKGYCSDGDECRKKHSYTCPVFEATGSCSQGWKCKLHHPKNQSKGRKRKRPAEPSERNSRGRYFGSRHKVFSESEPMVVDRRPTNSADFGIEEGLDFIFLGATEYEAGDNSDLAGEESVSSASEERFQFTI